jgi:hypothetical protein
MIDDALVDTSFAEVLRRLDAVQIGHAAAMEALCLNTYHDPARSSTIWRDLVRVMHHNGRMKPRHRSMDVAPKTIELITRITRPRSE